MPINYENNFSDQHLNLISTGVSMFGQTLKTKGDSRLNQLPLLIKQQAEEDNIGESAAEQNLKKGGLVRSKTTKKSKYGMKAGGFTSRGTMHRAHKK